MTQNELDRLQDFVARLDRAIARHQVELQKLTDLRDDICKFYANHLLAPQPVKGGK